MRKPGTLVTIRCPADEHELEDTWLQGYITNSTTSLVAADNAYMWHVVKIIAFKWAARDAWGPYDGIPEVLARETEGKPDLEWVDRWPPGR